MTAEAILSRLAEIAKLIESHRATQFLLEQERADLQMQLRRTDWKPPEVPA